MTTEYTPGQRISAVYWTSVFKPEIGKVKIISKMNDVEVIE